MNHATARPAEWDVRFERVTVSFAARDRASIHAVRELSLNVEAGETLCLIGASGSGKTTALRLINGLQRASSGRVLVGGEDVAGADPIALRRHMGYVIQAAGLFPHMSVRENVGLLCELEGWSEERRRARVDGLLELVHLSPDLFAERFPAELSGGQQQRVGVARALALDPPILLMDEPFGALDPITRRDLQREFLELRDTSSKTTVIVSHDLTEAFRLGHRVALLRAGELVQVGTRAEFHKQPADEHVADFLRAYEDG